MQYYQALHSVNADFSSAKGENFKSTKDPKLDDFNVLLLGSDSRGSDQGRSDSILILHYDSKAKKPKVVSLMRDSYVDIPNRGKQKLNAAYSYGGVELLRETIQQNFDIKTDYYLVTDFSGFAKIIDTAFPDGVTITSDSEMSKNIGMTIHSGKQQMDGKTLLAYSRFRYDAQSDFGRVKRQQQVVQSVMKQGISNIGITEIPSLLGLIKGNISTNIPTKLLVNMGQEMYFHPPTGLDSLTVPTNGSYEGKTYPGAGAVLEMDLDKNQAAIKKFLSDDKS
ncbi:LCP family protein [Listeria riparia]|uniref:Regulatory protein MsrR n=1 Tax=Listeria riparia FSL S10-1204 TaxID=1265816 RepID=W7DK31_9LIST|nr:LCP family protein [Listeria riparia]EUJ45723.1 regulatory protein msrR [Listeria riparia FSL S10-1204]